MQWFKSNTCAYAPDVLSPAGVPNAGYLVNPNTVWQSETLQLLGPIYQTLADQIL